MLGGQFLVLGMLGELGARIYYHVKQLPPYAVRHVHQHGTEEESQVIIPFRRVA
jgi:hypothetical protein